MALLHCMAPIQSVSHLIIAIIEIQSKADQHQITCLVSNLSSQLWEKCSNVMHCTLRKVDRQQMNRSK